MQNLMIESTYHEKLPLLKLGVIKAKVHSEASSEALLAEMNQLFSQIAKSIKVEDISKLPEITAGRAAYRAFGKDPTKYRISAEKLLRRIVKGEGLDPINNVVDLSNILSLSFRCPVGTFDYDKINGQVALKAGATGETFFSLGNQALNIEGFPVFYDEEGPFGSTTSDSARTAVDLNTKTILMTIFGFHDGFDFEGAMLLAERLIVTYAQGEVILSEVLTGKKQLQID